MASILLVLTCVYFSLNPSFGAFSEMSETLDSNQDLKLAITKIEELQKIVRIQEDRIISLEKRPKESKEQVTELKHTLNKQSGRITQLETRVIELEAMLREEKEKESTAMHSHELETDLNQPSYISSSGISVFRNSM